MKKKVCILFAIGIVLSVSTSVYAIDNVFTIMLREWFPGIENGGVTEGALASGNIFDSDGDNVGWVNISWSHNGLDIEACGQTTTLLRLKLVMNFNDGGRLVLVGPANGPVGAYWGYDDPLHPDGNILLMGYSRFLDPDTDTDNIVPNVDPPGDMVLCDDTIFGGDPNAAYIAQVPRFQVVRQRVGSYGVYGRSFRWGDVHGFLDHRPFVSPAVVGKVILHE